ncbi:hypothetical protein [Caulobacter endophyticus]|uniref:hypothetical protein n=1 Tax=Caulobacter endophyticus TaxID=2172652 RepID=UPI0018EEA091|nr:hypothetical protein [Caulobacter endophyticus]
MDRLISLPRINQANLDRLVRRVIGPVLERLPVHGRLETGQAPTLDVFLDRCAAQVDNHLANEAAKAFALTLSGVFERQLHEFALELWSLGLAAPPTRKDGTPASPKYDVLLALCAGYAGIDLVGHNLARPLGELLLVANVVRHGEGGSCARLHEIAPRLWDDPDGRLIALSPGPALLSERMRILPEDLSDYAVAAMVFWGWADTQVGAVTVIPGYAPVRRLDATSAVSA